MQKQRLYFLDLLRGMDIFLLTAVGPLVWAFLIDRIGRRQMLIWGGAGYIVSLFGCAASFVLGWNVLAAACIFLFIFSHAVGQGTVIWVFISEVFPLMTARMPTWSIFALFGAFMVIHILWAAFVVPETKGKALEDISLQRD